jgi:hypothetical protein
MKLKFPRFFLVFMYRLDSVFSHIVDWEKFYADFRKKDHDSITKFACLVHKVKDVPGEYKWLDSSLVFTLAKSALYQQENPYRIPRAAPVASNSPNESWASRPAP